MILVVGMARSGLAAARLLQSRGRAVFVTDAGAPPADELDSLRVPYETGGHTLSKFLEADEIVVSPGVPSDIPPLAAARAKGVPIVSELELASRYLKGEIVGITGSNGKTTTTTLVGAILQASGRKVQVGGNIGTALCGLVDTSTDETINVVEISSFQLDGILKFRPAVGALLNVTPDHLDRYANFESYRRSKFRLFENQDPADAAVLNMDDPQVHSPPVSIRAQTSFFSRTRPLRAGAFRSEDVLYLNGAPVLDAREVLLRGEHNIENVLASMAITARYEVPLETLAETIRSFRGVEHRIESAGSIRGIEFFNDSKATNVDSAIKAVQSFQGNILLILGGKDKGASYEPLVGAMGGRVKHVLLIGAAADRIAEAIAGRFPVSRTASLEEAVHQAVSIGAPGDVVLLSPACASFDMFNNFEHRGQVFKAAVQELSRRCQNA